jgi:hypothetical protein
VTLDLVKDALELPHVVTCTLGDMKPVVIVRDNRSLRGSESREEDMTAYIRAIDTLREAFASPLQLTFIFGLWVSLLTLMKGARLVLVSKFTTDAIGRCIEGWPASRRCFGLCWRTLG